MYSTAETLFEMQKFSWITHFHLLRKVVSDKETVIKDKNTIINLLQEEINESKNSKLTSSYAEITSNIIFPLQPLRQPVNNIISVIITPVKTQDAQIT